ncbi:MAG: hypothetical protein ABJC74_01000 [Gemmatimonadota bacterium]
MSGIGLALAAALLGSATAHAQGTAADSGVITPGMTVAQVEAVWGKPIRTVTSGGFGYLYYASGCLKSCGSEDVVFLDHGQVIDAIARGPGHRYNGVTSLSPERKPGYTAPTH